MSAEDLVGLIVGSVLLVYLVVALLRADKTS